MRILMTEGKDIQGVTAAEEISLQARLEFAGNNAVSHFGDLDISNVYVHPSSSTASTASPDIGFMLGDAGQELLPASTVETAEPVFPPVLTSDIADLLGDMVADFNAEDVFDVALPAEPVARPTQYDLDQLIAQSLHSHFSDYSEVGMNMTGTGTVKSVLDLDLLFDTVGAKVAPQTFGDLGHSDIRLEGTFWDGELHPGAELDLAGLFEPMVAIDPSSALENIFETLYVADES